VANVIEHLVKLWEDQLKGYEIEEQGLRVMLDEAVVERTKSEISQDKQILTEWKTLLFGKQETCSSFYKAAEQDVDAFIAIRYPLKKCYHKRVTGYKRSYVYVQCLPKNIFTIFCNTLLPSKSI